jgi:uncharacterized protein YegL
MSENLSAEFITNQEQRLPCMIVLDTSGSMEGERIENLNQGLKDLVEELRADELTSKRVDLAIMTFSDKFDMVHDFRAISQWEGELPELKASGRTNMGAALLEALRCISARKHEYHDNAIAYYRPWLFLLTDGEPTDETKEASAALRDAQEGRHVAVFPVAVGADVDLAKLESIAQAKPRLLNEHKWKQMWQWLGNSLAVVSKRKIGEQVAMPVPDCFDQLVA